MTFPQFAKRKRIAGGVSQQLIADALGLNHRSDVHKREAGKVEWKFYEVINLAHTLGQMPSEFLREFEDQ